MAIDRVSAVALPTAWAQRPPSRGPATGDMLRLTLAETLLDEVLATTQEGQPLRLTGPGASGRGLTAGDVLLVRVLATTPRVELALLDTPARPASGGAATTSPALQPDQLTQRQLSWRPPDAAALARSWRTMVLGPSESQATARVARQAADAGMPSPLGPARFSVRDPAPDPAPVTLPWLYPAYAWGGLHVTLCIVDPDQHRRPRTPPQRPRRAPLALRLEAEVPALGRVAVQIQLVTGGVQLMFFVERGDSRQTVRQTIPALARALSAADLRLIRCGVAVGLPGPGSTLRWACHGAPPPAALPPLLFRASAEVAVALAHFVPRGGFSPVAR